MIENRIKIGSFNQRF